ncbi:unnamed protein product [Closterium sp. Naga37s-1]|nr:unnamed protein product [Closterium sp. Naga37s-1]
MYAATVLPAKAWPCVAATIHLLRRRRICPKGETTVLPAKGWFVPGRGTAGEDPPSEPSQKLAHDSSMAHPYCVSSDLSDKGWFVTGRGSAREDLPFEAPQNRPHCRSMTQGGAGSACASQEGATLFPFLLLTHSPPVVCVPVVCVPVVCVPVVCVPVVCVPVVCVPVVCVPVVCVPVVCVPVVCVPVVCVPVVCVPVVCVPVVCVPVVCVPVVCVPVVCVPVVCVPVVCVPVVCVPVVCVPVVCVPVVCVPVVCVPVVCVPVVCVPVVCVPVVCVPVVCVPVVCVPVVCVPVVCVPVVCVPVVCVPVVCVPVVCVPVVCVPVVCVPVVCVPVVCVPVVCVPVVCVPVVCVPVVCVPVVCVPVVCVPVVCVPVVCVPVVCVPVVCVPVVCVPVVCVPVVCVPVVCVPVVCVPVVRCAPVCVPVVCVSVVRCAPVCVPVVCVSVVRCAPVCVPVVCVSVVRCAPVCVPVVCVSVVRCAPVCVQWGGRRIKAAQQPTEFSARHQACSALHWKSVSLRVSSSPSSPVPLFAFPSYAPCYPAVSAAGLKQRWQQRNNGQCKGEHGGCELQQVTSTLRSSLSYTHLYKFDAEKYVDDQMQIMDERVRRAAAGGGPGGLPAGVSGRDAQERVRQLHRLHPHPRLFPSPHTHILPPQGVRLLVGDLADYRRVSADEMRKSVFANYTAFIGTSKEIAELEVELQQMKNLLSVQTALIHSLAADSMNNDNSNSSSAGGGGGGGSTPASTTSSVTTAGTSSTFAGVSSASYASSLATPQQDEEEDERLWSVEVPEPTEIEKYAEALPDILDILIAERKVDRAIELLEQGQQIVQLALATAGDGAGGGGGGGKGGGAGGEDEEILSADAANALAASIAERRAWLMAQLEETAQQAAVRGQELRQAVGALYRLGETERAHQLLLGAYGERIRSGSRLLRPRGTSFGGAYTAALAQLVFSAISQAATDSARIFASDPAFAADLLLWAQRETEFCVSLLKRHVLSSAAAAGGLHAAAECVRIALGHCRLLEEQGLTLSPVLSKLVRPSVEEALEFNIIRIEDSVATMVAVDDWVLLPLPHGAAATGRVRALQQTLGPGLMHLRLSSSGQRFYLLLVDLVEDILPLISLQLFGRILDRLASLFESYVALLQKALPSPSDDDDDEEDGGNGGEGGKDKGGEKGGEKENGDEPWQDGSVRTAEDEQQQLALLGNASALADDLLPRLAQRLTLAAGEEGGGGGGRAGRKQGGADPDRRLSAGGRNAAEHKEWRRRLQKAVDKLRDVLCSCLVAEFMYGHDGQPILTARQYLHMDAKMRPTQWALKPLPSPPFQALYMALHSIHSTATYVLGGRDRVVTLLLMRLAEWLMMGLMVYSSFWDELENAEYALGPTGLQQLVFDMYFVMQVAKAGKYSSRAMRKVAEDSATKAIVLYTDQTGGDPNRAMRKVAEDSATKAIVLYTDQTGGDPNSLLQEDWWYEHKCVEAIEELAAAAVSLVHSTLLHLHVTHLYRFLPFLVLRPRSLLQEDWWYEHKCVEAIEELAAAASPAASPTDSPSRHRRSFSQEDPDDPLAAASSAAAASASPAAPAGAVGTGAVGGSTAAAALSPTIPGLQQQGDGGLSQQQQGPGRGALDEVWRPTVKGQYDMYDDDGGVRSARPGGRGTASRSPRSEAAGGGPRSRGFSEDEYGSGGGRSLQQQGDGGLSQQQQGPGRGALDEVWRPTVKGQYDMYDDDGGVRSARPGGRGTASRSPRSEAAGGGPRSRGFSEDEYGSGGGRSLQQQGDGGLSQQQQGPGRGALDEVWRPTVKGQYDMYDDDGGVRSARPGGRGTASRSPRSEAAGGGPRSRGFSEDEYGSGGGRIEKMGSAGKLRSGRAAMASVTSSKVGRGKKKAGTAPSRDEPNSTEHPATLATARGDDVASAAAEASAVADLTATNPDANLDATPATESQLSPPGGTRKRAAGDDIDAIFNQAKQSKQHAAASSGQKGKGGAKEQGSEKPPGEKKGKKKGKSGSGVDADSKARKRTVEGFRVYKEEELGWNKKTAGGTAQCPFDCDCCF